MERVIVTVKRPDLERTWDLEVPSTLESMRLADMIIKAMHWTGDSDDQLVQYALAADPPGRRLAPAETLAEAGVWDGACLTLEPADTNVDELRREDADAHKSDDVCQGPVIGWVGLENPLSGEPGRGQEKGDSDHGRFEWKQLDP